MEREPVAIEDNERGNLGFVNFGYGIAKTYAVYSRQQRPLNPVSTQFVLD